MNRKFKVAGVLIAMSLVMCGHVVSGGVQTDCDSSTSAVQFDLTTGLYSCGTINAGGATGGLLTVSVQDSDITDDTAAGNTTITGLTIPVEADTSYSVHCFFVTSGENASTGVQLGMDCPASPTAVTIAHHSFSNATTEVQTTFNVCGSVHAILSSAGATRVLNEAHMMLRNGSNAGDVQAVVTTDGDGLTATVHIGSWCEYYEIAS